MIRIFDDVTGAANTTHVDTEDTDSVGIMALMLGIPSRVSVLTCSDVQPGNLFVTPPGLLVVV